MDMAGGRGSECRGLFMGIAPLVAADHIKVSATAPLASPAALVAMKLHAIEDRRPQAGVDQRAGDAWDLYWLLADLDADASIRNAFNDALAPVRTAVRSAPITILDTGAARTCSWLRAGGAAMAAVTTDELRFLAAPLIATLA